jgi:hypothetical protein
VAEGLEVFVTEEPTDMVEVGIALDQFAGAAFWRAAAASRRPGGRNGPA